MVLAEALFSDCCCSERFTWVLPSRQDAAACLRVNKYVVLYCCAVQNGPNSLTVVSGVNEFDSNVPSELFSKRGLGGSIGNTIEAEIRLSHRAITTSPHLET